MPPQGLNRLPRIEELSDWDDDTVSIASEASSIPTRVTYRDESVPLKYYEKEEWALNACREDDWA